MKVRGYDPRQECEAHLMSGCTFCSGKFTFFEPPKPAKPARPKVKARKDRTMTIADLVAEGRMCSICLTLYAPIGCNCSRRARFDRLVPDSQDWLEEHHLELDTGKRNSKPELIAAGLAFTSGTRQARRAGIPRDAYPDRPSDQDADRLDILTRFGVEPKWTPPRTQQADFLPV